jgi:hypothetical protein
MNYPWGKIHSVLYEYLSDCYSLVAPIIETYKCVIEKITLISMKLPFHAYTG